MQSESLRWKIANCPHYFESLDDDKRPCHLVINSQMESLSNLKRSLIELEELPRPIPWSGNIESSKILFLHCSPYESAKVLIPRWDSSSYHPNEITNFDYSDAFENPDLVKDEVAHGSDLKENSEISKTNQTKIIAKFAKEMSTLIMGVENHEDCDEKQFSIFNLVRCSSPSKRAILKAIDFCSQNWLTPTLLASGAELVFVLGHKPAKIIAQAFPNQVPSDWGSFQTQSGNFGKGFWPRSKGDLQERFYAGQWKFENQKFNSFQLILGERKFLIVFHGTPGAGSIWSFRQHSNLISDELIDYWRSFISRRS